MLQRMLRTIVVAGALGLFGCGPSVGNDGADVGGSCAVSSDCVPASRCVGGDEFPGGICTRSCSSDDDCPDGSACVDEEGGICLVECSGASDCREDEGYQCVETESEGGPANVRVCIRP